MKKILFIIAIIAFATPAFCRNADSLNYELTKKKMLVDSLNKYLHQAARKHTNNNAVVSHVDAIIISPSFNHPTKFMLDTDYVQIKREYFLEVYRIKRVQFYLKLMHRRPKDVKYAKGWLLRAVS